ncbi:MAG: hypothetical protein JSW43_07945 [Gemmatimonadota bacterium]|nr:MAG: hypothetical protein JSW43_07945 [Gemmatimonadota bacterium]
MPPSHSRAAVRLAACPPRSAAALALLALACGGPNPDGQTGVTRRDSAGVAIYQAAGLGPRIEARETLRLGVVDGPPELTFFRLRDARLGPGGMIVVLDGGDDRVKLFDSAGRALRTLGGTGEGPAEFSAAWLLELRGDTLRVLDTDQRKIVTFSLDGELLATRRIGFSVFQHGFPEAFASAPGGRLFIAGVRGCGFPRGPNDNQWGLFAFGPDGAVEDTLQLGFVRDALPVYASSGRSTACTVIPWPFEAGPTLAFDPAGGGVWSPGDAFEIRWLDESLARITAIMRYPVERRAVTDAQRRAFQDILDAREFLSEQFRRTVEQSADSAGYPDVWPAVEALQVAGPGTVWARRVTPTGAVEQEWDVLTDGRHVRTVVLPAALRVTDIDGNRVLGAITDELDVEYVALFTVR